MENRKQTFSDAFVSKVTNSVNDFTSFSSNIPVKAGNLGFQKRNVIPHLVTFINFHSSLFICPFRIVYCPENENFQISSSKSRKAFSGLFTAIAVLCVCLWSYTAMVTAFISIRSVTTVFSIISNIGTVAGGLTLLKIFWLRGNDITRFVNLINSGSQNYLSSQSSWTLIKTVGICFFALFIQFLHGVCTAYRIEGAEYIYSVIAPIFSSAFSFLNLSPAYFLQNIFGFDAVRYLGLGIFSFFSCIPSMTSSAFLVLTWTMDKLAMNGLITQLNDNRCNVHEAMMHYEKVKAAAKDLTKIFSNSILFYYISGITFFAHLPQIILDPTSDVVNKAIMYCYLVLIGSSMCMAARVNILIEESLRNFIQKSQLQIKENNLYSMDQRLVLIALRQDMETDPVGVSSCFFTITKSFLSSTIGLVVTYSIILLQLPHEKAMFIT